MSRKFSKKGVAMLAAMVLATPVAFAQDNQALDVIHKLSDFYAQQATVSVEVSVEYSGRVNDNKENMSTRYEIALKRPAHLGLHVKNTQMELYYYTNEQNSTQYIPPFNQYRVEATPIIPAIAMRRSSFHIITPATFVFSELFEAEPFKRYFDEHPAAEYIGRETLGGNECDVVQISYSDYVAKMWIDAGDQPVLRRIEPDMSQAEASVRGDSNNEVELKVVLDIERWTFGENVDAQIAFLPPSGATKVAQFAPPRPEPEANKLLGKSAPPFTLALLDGGTLNIADKGENEIVILDFWATWCGPCRVAMPIIDKVSRKYASQGVKLYAVNLQEERDEILEFLNGAGLDINVALDTEGKVSELYRVSSIPQTVIIGKDGTVQVVHIGINQQLFESQLTGQLEALIRGESLVRTD